MNPSDLARVAALGVTAGVPGPTAEAPTPAPPAEPPIERDGAPPGPRGPSSRPRYLTALVKSSDPPRHPRSFRPTEVVRELYIGGIRDCKSVSALHYATGARLIVRACPIAKQPAFEIVSLPSAGSTKLSPSTEPSARCRTLEEFLQALSVALDAESSRARFEQAAVAGLAEADADDVEEGKPRAPAGSAPPSRRAIGVMTLTEAQDVPSYNMLQHFPSVTAALALVWSERGLPVVVHCAAGVSRSVSCVIAFLLAEMDGFIDPALADAGVTIASRGILCNRVSVADVLRVIQARRPQAGPNDGFMQQLSEWQKKHQRNTRANQAAPA